MMAKLIILVVNLFCLFSASVGIQEPGQCDQTIPVVTNFNLQNFAGVWYDIASYANTHQSGTCNTAEYTVNPDRTISVRNSQVINQVLHTASGTATAAADNTGKLQVAIGSSTTPIDYWVLNTDYTGHALIYSCRNVNANTREIFSWKLSRTRTLSQTANVAINAVIASTAALNQNLYVERNHSPDGCFHYPVFEVPPAEIELPGACETIRGISNFNAAAYLGRWYEVARYPQPTQQGQCNRANYEDAGNGVVSVLNTQVVNEQLATISGQAVANADGTGNLTVTFVVAGESRDRNLLVLATDYINYALVYSCTNLPNGNRIVGSWKLSRTRTLSPQAAEAMASVINNVQGLREEYYQSTSQSDSACFYYPEFDGSEGNIDLPGTCETAQIRGIPNFNPVAYLGLWYEVAKYPQLTQPGQCSRATYGDAGNGIVSVVNTQIVREELYTISGQASLISTDGSGKLEVILNVGGIPLTSTLYVLGTDYTGYSLAYSCTNLPNGNRRVSSWILSRRREGLTSQETANINTIISNTQGLKQEYYQPTSQSDASCFYYPEFDTLPETIDLPGPCETTVVTGIPNFNINSYAGLWYEVARYPQPTQQGQCNRATYTVEGSGIAVTNRHVVNQALFSISGQATVASADNSGKLEVTFVIGGQPTSTNLYVLSTDYNRYSVLYSCANLPNGNRRVGSWILSRTPQLPYIDEIQTVIDSTQGLKRQYYQRTNQTDEACFYYPAETVNNEVRLPGQCNETITGVSSFNLTAFARTWYHIERYDTVQNRNCSATRFTLNSGANTVNVVDYEVYNGELVTTQGTGRINSTDGTGRLVLTTTGRPANESSEIIVKILDTDYTGYAVAYSCENVDANYRRVRAWVLSHERTLPASATPIINALKANTLELHDPYFNSVRHNDNCPEPSSAMLFKSSIIVIFICTVLQMLW